jgi:hypothetical protein
MPNRAGAQSLEENGETGREESGSWLLETHEPGRCAQFRMIPTMFHVKHFGPVEAQNLTRRKQGLPLNLIRSTEFLVRFESGRGGASIAQLVA